MIRFCKHLVAGPWQVSRYLSKGDLQDIERAIASSEKKHRGEIRFVVEAGLDPLDVVRRRSPRDRAIEVFSLTRVWDTEENTGVLLYLLLADHDIEIVADRGINACVDDQEWKTICDDMEQKFRQGEFKQAIVDGLDRIGALLSEHFPGGDGNENELPNKPVVL